MAGPIEKDLIRSVCGSAGDRFGRVSCKYYDTSTGDCHLIKDGKMDKLFKEKPRCNPEKMIESSVRKNYYRYSDDIKPKEYIKSTVFTLLERLKNKSLTKGHNLAVLHGYINQSSYNEVQKILKDEGLLVKKNCGNCIFLSNSKPPICTKAEYIDETSGETKPNPYYGKKRVPSKDTCKEGFKALSVFSINRYEDRNENDNASGNDHAPKLPEELKYEKKAEELLKPLDLEKMRIILENRAKSSKQETTKRKYERHHDIFNYHLNLYNKKISETEINRIVAEKINTNEESVRNDMKEIIKYLKSKISLDN